MHEHPSLFASARWFSTVGIRDVSTIEHQFSDDAGMLPGNLPVLAICSFDWRTCIAILSSILRHTPPRGRPTLSLRFMDAVFARLSILISDSLIPSAYYCYTWRCRTEGERLCLDHLIDVTFGDSAADADRLWRNRHTVPSHAIFWTEPIIPSIFLHLNGGTMFFFQNTVRFERRFRSDTGYFLSYQMVEAREISRQHYANRYQRVPS